MGLLRDIVCCTSLLIVLDVTGQLLSWFSFIWGLLGEVYFFYFLFSTEISGI